MCFGQRTRYTCPVCRTLSWETRWYNFGAGADRCAMGAPNGTCIDPWMVYHNEERFCAKCLKLYAEDSSSESSSSSPIPSVWHPDDPDHRESEILNYDKSEIQTMTSTGQLTLPGIVARELHKSIGTTIYRKHVPEHLLLDQIDQIMADRSYEIHMPGEWVETPTAITSRDRVDASGGIEEDIPGPPSTPVTTEIYGSIFQGPLPDPASMQTPLPSYNETVAVPPPPRFTRPDPRDMPINLRVLKRLADYTHHLRWQLIPLRERLVRLQNRIASRTGAQDIIEAANVILQAIDGTIDTADYNQQLIMSSQATIREARGWISLISRNPDVSVRNQTHRFREWIMAMESEVDFLCIRLVVGYPARRQVNEAFDREEIRDQIRQDTLLEEHIDAGNTQRGDLAIINLVQHRDLGSRDCYNVDDEDDIEFDDDFVPVDLATGDLIRIPDFEIDEDHYEYSEAGIEEAVAVMEIEDNGDELYSDD